MAKIKIHNIKSFTKNSTSYPGIVSAEINVNKGRKVPDQNEGDLYPSGSDNVGTTEFPVTGTITLEDMSQALTLLNSSAEDVVIVGVAHGSNSDQEFTISNAEFFTQGQQLQRQEDGRTTLQYQAHSADGSALPLAIADVV